MKNQTLMNIQLKTDIIKIMIQMIWRSKYIKQDQDKIVDYMTTRNISLKRYTFKVDQRRKEDRSNLITLIKQKWLISFQVEYTTLIAISMRTWQKNIQIQSNQINLSMYRMIRINISYIMRLQTRLGMALTKLK